jgi:type IV secretory pathway VirB2 component (pilin)
MSHATFWNSPRVQRITSLSLLVLIAQFILIEPAMAGGLPWETGIARFAQSLCGPTAKAIGVIAFVSAGIAIGFGEVKGWIHNLLIVMIGVSIAVLSPTILGLLGVSTSIACN